MGESPKCKMPKMTLVIPCDKAQEKAIDSAVLILQALGLIVGQGLLFSANLQRWNAG